MNIKTLFFIACVSAMPLFADPCTKEQIDRATTLATKMMMDSFFAEKDNNTIALAHCICLSYIAYSTTHNEEEFDAFMKNTVHNIEMFNRYGRINE